MTAYFLDSSALVKRHIMEPGHARVNALCDPVQLACALAQRERELVAGRHAPIFVCSDVALLSAAQVEGFAVENPNVYP